MHRIFAKTETREILPSTNRWAVDFAGLLRLGGNAERNEHRAKHDANDFDFLSIACCRVTHPYFHRMTLSARASTFGGIVRPICLAAFKFDDELKLRRLLETGKIGWFGALEDSVQVGGDAAVSFGGGPRCRTSARQHPQLLCCCTSTVNDFPMQS